MVLLVNVSVGYVEDGIKVSINGFEASSWAERNSGTLLFRLNYFRFFLRNLLCYFEWPRYS